MRFPTLFIRGLLVGTAWAWLGPAQAALGAEQSPSATATPPEVNSTAAAISRNIPPLPELVDARDAITMEIRAYRSRIRNCYNSQQFPALEAAANEARDGKKRFKNGSWEVFQFYDCLRCRDDEPESMWQLHDRIHQAWTEAYPDSITPRVAHAEFFTSYAWHARGGGYADQVSPEDWVPFNERMAKARQLLDSATALPAKCPMWWRIEQDIALGQGWKRAAYDKLFEEAKAFDPQFFLYDLARATYLLPRWYGVEGEWESVAKAEIARANGLGMEGYARVVTSQRVCYANIFTQTKASWPDVREGYAELRHKYPDSLEVLSGYTELACLAGDRTLARELFLELGGRVDPVIWGKRANTFVNFRMWAFRDDKSMPPDLNNE